MKMGMYEEARKAGFTGEQAGFLVRRLVDIRHECWGQIDEDLASNRKWNGFLIACAFAAGIVVGAVI